MDTELRRRRNASTGTIVFTLCVVVAIFTGIFTTLMAWPAADDSLYEDPERYTLMHHQCSDFITGVRLTPDHREMICRLQSKIPDALGPSLMMKRGELVSAIRVSLLQSTMPTSWKGYASESGFAYWHVGRLHSPQDCSRVMAGQGVADRPPGGFTVFKARFGKYLLHGLAHEEQVGQIIKSLDPDEFMAFSR